MDLAVQQKVLVEVNSALSTSEFQAYQVEISTLVDTCKKFTIKDPETLQTAIDMISQVRGLEKRLDAARKKVLEEAGAYTTSVNNKVRQWMAPLKEADSAMETKILNHRRLVAQKLREVEEKARREAAKLQGKLEKQAEKIGTAPIKVPPPKVAKQANISLGTVGKVAGKKTWKCRLTNIKLLAKAVVDGDAPEEMLTFDESFSNNLARKSQGAREISGVEFYQKEGLGVYAT